MKDLILTNARIIGPETDFNGSVVIENGLIVDIFKDIYFDEGINLHGQWLAPGIIDIHSDYLEKEIHPRPSATFPLSLALHHMDLRAALSGITTLYSAISFSEHPERNRSFNDAIEFVREIENKTNDCIINHHLHARFDPNTSASLKYMDEIKDLEKLDLIIYNESIPGQRQFSIEKTIDMWSKRHNQSRDEIEKLVIEAIKERSQINHRKEIQEAFQDNAILGSHDDTTPEHVIEAKQFGATLSEMPTTLAAAKKAKELDMWVCMGAPNYYLGGSHCGNLSAIEALDHDLVDMFCSDYHFPTLLSSVVKMIKSGMSPSHAFHYVSLNPARLLGFDHLGSIETGKTADLISFEIINDYAIVANVFIKGTQKISQHRLLQPEYK